MISDNSTVQVFLGSSWSMCTASTKQDYICVRMMPFSHRKKEVDTSTPINKDDMTKLVEVKVDSKDPYVRFEVDLEKLRIHKLRRKIQDMLDGVGK